MVIAAPRKALVKQLARESVRTRLPASMVIDAWTADNVRRKRAKPALTAAECNAISRMVSEWGR